jgi:hypothetical protein
LTSERYFRNARQNLEEAILTEDCMWIEDLLNFTFADEHWNHNGVWKRKKERKKKERKKERKKEKKKERNSNPVAFFKKNCACLIS